MSTAVDSLARIFRNVYTPSIVRQTPLTQRNVYRFIVMYTFEALLSCPPHLYSTVTERIDK